jgi:2-(1,2-epoxy-1,2-dihydrophenyl)acetyl-CoA isomerase
VSEVLYTVEARIGTVTLNRPDRLNAFTDRTCEELVRVIKDVARDDRTRVLIVTGAGGGFCAGADVAYLQDVLARRDLDAANRLLDAGRTVVSTLASTPKPVIAAVNGAAAGGGAGLALACDLRLASDNASIGQVFNRIGLHPDWGATYFLPRLVGPSKAMELIFTAEMIDASEALRLGLFNRVVPHDQLLTETRRLAEQLARKPPIAIALAKQAVSQSLDSSLAAMLDLELAHQSRCFSSEDAREGISAFAEKRVPAFRGV